MMPLKQGKILPPSPMRKASEKPEYVFLLDSAGAPAVPYEPCTTGVMVVQGRALRAESSKLYHMGIRGHTVPRRTIFDLPVPDGRQLRMCRVFPFMRPPIYSHPDLANGLPLQRQLYRMRRQTMSKKRSRAAGPKKIRRCGNSFSSVPVGFLRICSKPSH